MMNNMLMNNDMLMSTLLSEDVNAPELRSPRHSGLRKGKGWLARLFDGLRAEA